MFFFFLNINYISLKKKTAESCYKCNSLTEPWCGEKLDESKVTSAHICKNAKSCLLRTIFNEKG